MTVRSRRLLACLTCAMALMIQSSQLPATQSDGTSTQDGKFVSTAKTQLVMTGWDGSEHTLKLIADTKCTLDGKECRLDTLKSGTRIRVAITQNDPETVTRVEAIAKDEAFADAFHDGALVSLTKNQLVMTDTAGKEHSHRVDDKVKMTLDTKDCGIADVQPGTKIRVFTVDPFSNQVLRVEAIANNATFASNRQEGKFVSAVDEKLVMTNLDGKERSLSLPSDAVLWLDGKPCKLADLKAGTRVRITTRDAFSLVATKIEGLKADRDFALDTQDGKIVRVTTEQMVMTDLQGGAEQTCKLSANVKITLDGKTVKITELKRGMKVRITSNGRDADEATRIEALDKNQSFVTSSL